MAKCKDCKYYGVCILDRRSAEAEASGCKIYEMSERDFVEVVRCKDCRHAEPFGVGFVCRYSSYAPYVGEMHYCANGWRKNNANMDGNGDG